MNFFHIRQFLFLCFLGIFSSNYSQEVIRVPSPAPAPLYNDPIYDGAADPVLIWNREEQIWWMLYTARRANTPTVGVSAYYGTRVGVATSEDHGQTWIFKGYLDLEFEKGWNTFWAPEVVFENGTYHMYVSYIRGVRNHWGGNSTILHFSSKNLWDWVYKEPLVLSSDRVIDATLYILDNGSWRIWYKDDKGGGMMMSESRDLKKWRTIDKPTIGGGAHEGPKVLKYRDYYWMLTDEWQGLRVYRSEDLES